MDDVISRQAAIDALEREKTYSTAFAEGYSRHDVFDKYNMALADGIKALRGLPSAHSAQPEQRWIPVTEQLPEDEQEVLVTRHFLSDNQLKKNAITESFYVEVASQMDGEWSSYSDEYKIKRHLHKVIAWMPLPKPYERSEE